MRVLGMILGLLLLAMPALAQIDLPPEREAAAAAAEKAAKAKAAAAAAKLAETSFSMLDSYARRCLVTLSTMRTEAPQTAIPASCAELPGFDGQPRDLAGSRIKEAPDGFTITVTKKGGGGMTLTSKTGTAASIPVGGKQICYPGLCTAQCCCQSSPAGQNFCCRFVPGKPAACD